MKNKKVLILLLLVLGALAIYLIIDSQTRSTIRPELKDFAIADTSQIGRVVISDKKPSTVEIDRINQKQWLANGRYKVKKDAMVILLSTLKRVAVKSPVANSMKPKVVSNMASGAKKVSIYNLDNELIKTIYVGGATQDHLGTFAMLEGSQTPFIVSIPGFDGYLSTRFFTDINQWRDQSVIKLDNSQLASIEVKYPLASADGYKLEINGLKDFELYSSQGTRIAAVDSFAVYSVLGSFRNLTFEGIVSKGDRLNQDSILNSIPFVELTVEDLNGNSKTLPGYRKANTKNAVGRDGEIAPFDIDRFYAEIEPGVLATCQYALFDRVFKTAKDLSAKFD